MKIMWNITRKYLEGPLPPPKKKGTGKDNTLRMEKAAVEEETDDDENDIPIVFITVGVNNV